jgi:hypothetical protein
LTGTSWYEGIVRQREKDGMFIQPFQYYNYSIKHGWESHIRIHYYFLSLETATEKIYWVFVDYTITNRRTFDKRFKVLPSSQIIAKMGNLFLLEKLADCVTVSVNSSMIKAVGAVWHKSSMKQNVLPIFRINIDARCGFSKSRGCVFSDKLHMSCG